MKFLKSGRGRALAQIVFAAGLSAVVFALVWRGMPPAIEGAKKVLVVGLSAAVNFALALMILTGGEQDAPLATDEDLSADEDDNDPPAIVRGIPFSDPNAVWLGAGGIVLGGAAMAIPLGAPGALRFMIGAALFMLPGYLLSVLLLPKSLGWVGRLLFSAVLSAAVVPSVAQVLYWMGFLFTVWIALVATLGVSMLLLVVARLAARKKPQN